MGFQRDLKPYCNTATANTSKKTIQIYKFAANCEPDVEQIESMIDYENGFKKALHSKRMQG